MLESIHAWVIFIRKFREINLRSLCKNLHEFVVWKFVYNLIHAAISRNFVAEKIREIKTSIHIFAAQASSATIDIVVKPRDSNDVWVRRNLVIDFELMFSRKKNCYYFYRGQIMI